MEHLQIIANTQNLREVADYTFINAEPKFKITKDAVTVHKIVIGIICPTCVVVTNFGRISNALLVWLFHFL